MIRNKKIVKVIVIFLLINFLNALFFPTISWALTSGDSQPEYTSYESFGTTDMVNLLTGNFTYNIPLINIPGPEGGFAMPLSYHGGIGPEQEATWVGLGWNINPGAISRNVNQYPDDAWGKYVSTDLESSNDIFQLYTSNPNVGSSFVKDYWLYQRTWNSETGYGGGISLLGIVSATWGKGQAGANLLGLVGWSQNGGTDLLGVHFQGGKISDDVQENMNAAFTIMSLGAGAIADGAFESVANAKAFAINSVGPAAIGASAALWAGSRAMGLVGQGNSNAYNPLSTHISQSFFGYTSQQSVNILWSEEMYGALYLGEMANSQAIDFGPNPGTDYETPALNSQKIKNFNQAADESVVGSDMNVFVDNGPYGDNFHPTNIAYDNYSVMGPGISGNVQPYRLEVGTLSVPNIMTANDHKYNIIPFLPTSSYKVNFAYVGEFSNSYTYQNSASDYLGFSYSYDLNTNDPNLGIIYTLNDETLSPGGGSIQPERYGLNNNRLVTGKHVEWYSNSDIINNTTLNNFMNYPNIDRTNLPLKGIGGFSVTNTDGTTYHYALPVYNNVQYAKSASGSDYTLLFQGSPYAYTWLLTGITGSDYVDANNNGSIDPNDWGYYVTLNYGKFSSNYHYRQPYWNYDQPVNNAFNYSEGLRESYYLNSIQTRTHTAIFINSIRPDGRAAYCRDGINCMNHGLNPSADPSNTYLDYNDQYPSSSLQLDEVFILNNQDYASLQGQGLIVNSNNNPTAQALVVNPTNPALQNAVNGDNLNAVFDQSDITSILRSSLYQVQLQRIVFNYGYTACPGTENSFIDASNPPRSAVSTPATTPAIGPGNGAKTTLSSVSIAGRNNTQVLPNYTFDYNLTGAVNDTNSLLNPSYTESSYDGWGMYTTDYSPNHFVSPGTTDANVWSLQRITTPMGAIMDITYERDSYYSVAQNTTYPTQVPLNITNFDPTTGIATIDISPLQGKTLLDCNWSSGFNASFNATEDVNIYNNSQVLLYIRSFPYSFTNLGQGASNVTTNTLRLSNFPILDLASGPPGNGEGYGGQGYLDANSPQSGYIWVTGVPSKLGGDLRVSMLHSYDNLNGDYKTAYIYTQDGTPTGLTSGVVSIEPKYVRPIDYTDETFNSFDYPNTGVMYGKVTVLTGSSATLNNYVSKTQYTFQTPNIAMVTNVNPQLTTTTAYDIGGYWQEGLIGYNNVVINTAQIGQLLSISKMDINNDVLSQNTFNYLNSTYQGVRTEGTILCEYENFNGDPYAYHHKLMRTTKTYVPSYLQSITTTVSGITSTATNNQFDFFTGEVTNKGYTNSLGINYQAVSVPAYQNYPGMGSKTDDPTNSHMLSALSGQYLYKVGQLQTSTYQPLGGNGFTSSLQGSLPINYHIGDKITLVNSILGGQTTSVITDITPTGFSIANSVINFYNLNSYYVAVPSNVSVVSCGIQTWNDTWTYRQFTNGAASNGNTYSYSDTPGNNSWRKQATYSWNSPLLNSDGTYQNFVDFNYSGNPNPTYWQKTSETTSYDVYSMPLEVKDINANYAATKMGFNQSYVLASATNANYNSFFYSGFEDVQSDGNFGGEVTDGATQYSATSGTVIAHTGSYVSQVSGGCGPGIRSYTTNSNPNSNILAGRRYRASVWAHNTSNASAQLVASINGVTAATASISSPTMTIGNWNLLSLTFDLPVSYSSSGTGINVYICSTGGTSYFDDFIVRPINAEFSANVYNPKTGLLMSTIDKDGLYTRYVYDTQNRITDTYKELSQGEVKISHYDYNIRNQNNIVQPQ